MVLLYFLQVRHHKYAAAVMVLSPEVLNIRLDPNAFKLCGELKRCHDTAGTNAYGTKDAHY